jgi:hypothetical protein
MAILIPGCPICILDEYDRMILESIARVRGGMDLKIEYRRPFDGHIAKYCVLDKNYFLGTVCTKFREKAVHPYFEDF